MHWRFDQNRSFQMVPSASTVFYFLSLPMSPVSVTKMYFWSFDSNFNDQSSTLKFLAVNNASLSDDMTITGYGSSLSLNVALAQHLYNADSFLNLAKTSWTFELWIYLASKVTTTDNPLIEQCQSRTKSQCFHISIRNEKAHIGFYDDGLDGSQINPLRWYHLAYTFDCETRNQSIYINGFLNAHRNATNCYQGQGGNLTIGRSQFHGTLEYSDSFIDQLYYFDRVRTTKEILDDAGLTVFLSFDNNSLNDQGSLGIHGYLNGSVNFTKGMVGDALQIHPIPDSFVRVTGLVLLGVSDQSYSISVWIRPSEQRKSTIVHVSDNPDGTGWCIAMLALTDQGQLIALSWSSGRRDLSGPIVPLNAWTHVAITYNNLVGLILYTNGTRSASSSAFSFTASGSTRNNLFLGSSLSGTLDCGGTSNHNGQYAGAMDEFRLYSRALTAAEIGNLVKP
jgi:hypothetical protein